MELLNYFRLRKEATRAKAMARLNTAMSEIPANAFAYRGAYQARSKADAADVIASSKYYDDLVSAITRRQEASMRRAKDALAKNPFSASAISRVQNGPSGSKMMGRASFLRNSFSGPAEALKREFATGSPDHNALTSMGRVLYNTPSTRGASLLSKYPVK